MSALSFIQNPFGLISVDIETSGLAREDEIVSMAISWFDNGEIQSAFFYLDRLSIQHSKEVQSNLKTVEYFLNQSLFNPNFKGTLIFHNLQFDMKMLFLRFKFGHRFSSREICKVSDTLILSRIKKNNKFLSHANPEGLRCHSLKYLALEQPFSSYSRNMIDSFEEATNGQNIRFADRMSLQLYNINDTMKTLMLNESLRESLAPSELFYFEEIEIPHALNLLYLELNGVPYDKEGSRLMLSELRSEMEILERDLLRAFGRPTNLSSPQAIGMALFSNPRLKVKGESLRPLYLTESGQAQVDLDTLGLIAKKISSIEPESPILLVLMKLMRHMEISKSISRIEILDYFAVKTEDGYFIYSHIAASALSGRVTFSKPSLLGLPKKIIKKSQLQLDMSLLGAQRNKDSLKNRSPRELIRYSDRRPILSIDINALDLAIIAFEAVRASGNDEFYWLQFLERKFGATIDSHFALLQKFLPSLYKEAFRLLVSDTKFDLSLYWAEKKSVENGRSGINFISKATGEKLRVEFPEDGGQAERALDTIREISKRINLATSYLMGASALAKSLSEALGRDISALEAQEYLDSFYEEFPEIRMAQDLAANEIYFQGYKESPFGRRFYAEAWDDLNNYYRRTQSGSGEYEFILSFKGDYWYLKAQGWRKTNEPVIQNLKYIDKRFGFHFDNVLALHKLNPELFEKKSKGLPKERITRKSEENLEENGDYLYPRIALTSKIQREIDLGICHDSDAVELLKSLIYDGAYLIPENYILFYKVELSSLASRYFKKYKSLLRTSKKFFPNYCQGVAGSVAKKILTTIRERIEVETTTATILLFIHDQFVVSCHPDEEPIVRKILEESVQMDVSSFPYKFGGELKGGNSFSL